MSVCISVERFYSTLPSLIKKKADVFVEIFIKYNLINDRMKPQRMQVYNAEFS